MLKIVIKKAGQMPEVKEIVGSLENVKAIVGGYIECVGMPENIICVCNEEGKLLGLPPNFAYNGDIIVGDVFFCAGGEEDFESLNDKQIELLMNALFMFEINKK